MFHYEAFVNIVFGFHNNFCWTCVYLSAFDIIWGKWQTNPTPNQNIKRFFKDKRGPSQPKEVFLSLLDFYLQR